MTTSADSTASSISAVSRPAASASGRAPRSAAQADDDVDPAVLQVERLRAALIAVAEDRDALAGQRRGIDVGVAEQVHRRRLALRLEQGQRLVERARRPAPPETRPIGGRLVREPGILPLGVAARRLLAGRDRLVERTSCRADSARSRARRSRASPADWDRACVRAASRPRSTAPWSIMCANRSSHRA